MADGAGVIMVDGGVGFTVAAVVRPQRLLAGDLLRWHRGRPPHGDILGAVLFSSLTWWPRLASSHGWAALQPTKIFFRERYHAYVGTVFGFDEWPWRNMFIFQYAKILLRDMSCCVRCQVGLK